MNPPNPFNPSLVFPSYNSNNNFSYSLPSNSNSQPLPPHSFSSLTPQTPNLHTTLSNLKHFVHLAKSAVKSVSHVLPLSDKHLSSCPFNPHHRIPSESLFRHSLRCPSSPLLVDLSILESLHYPNSFKSEAELRVQNPFFQSLQESEADLCFSIDGFGDFGSNFFYKDSPGVVCYPELDSTKSTFTLPRVLSLQCANFSASGNEEIMHLPQHVLGILPSDLLNLRSEMELWSYYPHSYSPTMFRVIFGLWRMKESDSLEWILLNSPRYGVVIDAPMRDHIFVLFKLCLRAISLEAYCSSQLNPMPLTINCPVLVEVMSWLASQLSVLYGEANGKFFLIQMLKHCLLSAASSLLLYSSDQKKTELCEGENLSGGENTKGGLVFVSQVAAAIAALHERHLLEEKIKGLWLAGSLSKPQLINEYSHVTLKANEERGKRANYRPILEHDGFLWQRSHNQGSSKAKTKEELLAEERDYKRRRMSYRGKKVKRSTTEVMRDIIEEHMEEIKQAGGIGCFVKGSAEAGALSLGYVHDITAADELRKNERDPSEQRKRSPGYRKESHFNFNDRSKRSKESPLKDYISTNDDFDNSHERHGQQSHGRQEPSKDHQRSLQKGKRDREYRPKRAESYRSRGQSNEQYGHQSKHDEIEVTKTKYENDSSPSSNRSKHHESRYYSSRSRSSTESSYRKYEHVTESKDRYRERKPRTHRSESINLFSDRYDPSKFDNRFEDAYDDEFCDSKYARLDKLYGVNDVEDDEVQRLDFTAKGRYHDHLNKF